MAEKELAYIRKERLRGKNRKVRIEQVYETENMKKAVHESQKHKQLHKGVREYKKNSRHKFLSLQNMIKEGTYHTSQGHVCIKYCPCGKFRKLLKLPYFPDHIAHHSTMQVLMPVLLKYYYYESAASVKGKGMHFTARRTARWIDENKDAGRLYYAKMDFIKFYQNIIQQKIYEHLCSIFGNRGIRYLLWEVVTACDEGLGIGLYPIQPIVNAYTCPLVRKAMSMFNVRIEIYCDDIVIMSRDKKEVWKAVNFIQDYARNDMGQPIHENVGVQIIDETHGLDFVGYQFFFNHTLLRDRMKRKFKRKMHRLKDPLRRYQAATSYKGWLIHCNGFNLWKIVMNMKSFRELAVPKFEKTDPDGKRMLDGLRVSMESLEGHEIVFLDVEFDVRSKYSNRNGTKFSAVVQVEEYGKKKKFFTNNPKLQETLKWCKENNCFPFTGTLSSDKKTGLPDYEIK